MEKFELLSKDKLTTVVGGKRGHSRYFHDGYGTAHNLRAGATGYNIVKVGYQILRYFA